MIVLDVNVQARVSQVYYNKVRCSKGIMNKE